MTAFLTLIACAGPAVAAVFASHALWLGVARAAGPVWASAVVALAWLLAASIAAAIVLLRRRTRQAASARKSEPSSAAAPIAVLERAVQTRPLQTTAAMLAVGAAVGRNPDAALKLAREVAAAAR
jgi:hypothetical protein